MIISSTHKKQHFGMFPPELRKCHNVILGLGDSVFSKKLVELNLNVNFYSVFIECISDTVGYAEYVHPGAFCEFKLTNILEWNCCFKGILVSNLIENPARSNALLLCFLLDFNSAMFQSCEVTYSQIYSTHKYIMHKQ